MKYMPLAAGGKEKGRARMPPRTKKEIKEMIQPILKELNIQTHVETTELDAFSQNMSYYGNWRKRHTDLTAMEPYKSIPIWGKKYSRLASFYLDDSNTPEAVNKNLELLHSLSTKEGVQEFTNRVARDILRIDLRKGIYCESMPEAAQIYAQNPRECEIAWAVGDLLNDGKEMLDPTVQQALQDRMMLLESLGTLQEAAFAIGSPFYALAPDITKEIAKENDDLGTGELYESKELTANQEVEDMAHAFDLYLSKFHDFYQMQTENEKKLAGFANKLFDPEKLTSYTIFKDENGNRLDYMDALNRTAKGEKVLIEQLPSKAELEAEGKMDQPSRDQLVFLAEKSEAEKPTKQVTNENAALYDHFSKEALSAQGKGLQEEYRRLLGEMNRTTYWFAIASPEFGDMRKELRRLGESETVPNREQAEASMTNMLKLANKYIADKAGKELKPREQKRLDAVIEVRDSLTARMKFLSNAQTRAEHQHANDAKVRAGIAADNLTNIHVSPFEQQLADCRNGIRKHENEIGAIGTLSQKVGTTLEKLSAYAVNPGFDLEKKGFVYGEAFDKSVAEMVLLGILSKERQLPGDAAHPIEQSFNKLQQDPVKWEEKIKAIRESETVKQAVRNIREDPSRAADYIDSTGSGKLADTLLHELGVKTKQKVNAPKAPVNQMEKQGKVGPAKK